MNAAIATGMNLHVASGTDTCLDAGTKVHVKAGVNLVLEAGVMISLKVGGRSITIGPAGVTLDGPLARINCGGSPLAALNGEKPDKAKKAGEAISGQAGHTNNTSHQTTSQAHRCAHAHAHTVSHKRQAGPLVRINCGGSPLAAMKGEKPDKAKKAGEAIAGKAGKISNPGQQTQAKALRRAAAQAQPFCAECQAARAALAAMGR